MKIVAVAACTSGIAHTYIAKEKLIRAAESLGHTIHVETQGTIGTEDELTPEEIKAADVVILAIDIATREQNDLRGNELLRFQPMLRKSAKQLLQKIEAELNK